jgi:hypothetical protein
MIFVLVIGLIGAVLIYFLFSIFKVVSKSSKPAKTQEAMYDVPYKASLSNDYESSSSSEKVDDSSSREHHAPLHNPVQQELKQSEIPGQTTNELNTPEPLQQKVLTRVEEPSANDTSAKIDSNAMFGSNLRHPEGMIQPSNSVTSLESDIASGVASNSVNNEHNSEFMFSSDMAQNNGEFMKGITAFDNTDTSSMFSSL